MHLKRLRIIFVTLIIILITTGIIVSYNVSNIILKHYSKSLIVIQTFVLMGCVLALTLTSYLAIKRYIILKQEKNKLTGLNKRLSEKEELFRTFFEQSPMGICFGNIHNDIVDVNETFERIVGRKKKELVHLSWADITHPEDLDKDIEKFEQLKAGKIKSYSIDKRYIKGDHSTIWINMTIAPLKFENNNEFNHLCIIEDISDKMKAKEELQESERSYAMLLSNLPGMTYRRDFERKWTMQFISEGCYQLTGYKPEYLLLNKEISYNELIGEEYRDYIWNKWNRVLKDKSVFCEEYYIITKTGEKKWVYEQGQGVFDQDGKVIAVEGLIIDISKQKKREDEIRFLNYHDALTGLHNRRFFEEERINYDEEKWFPLSVIVGDINGLKLLNDTLGHSEGDRIIIAISKILNGCCREGDILARTGGDEFSILLPNTDHATANQMVKNIIGKCENYKKTASEDTYHMSISLGSATKNSNNESLGSIIKDAEDSMYRHKLLQNKSLHSSVISSMKTSLYEKNQETEEHAQRLIDLSKAIGDRMRLVEEQLNMLELLSTLHDIGKIGISDSILNKPGKLTDDEWMQMRKHPEIGYRIAMSTPELAPIAEYILSHHERWDGNGYPQGLKGDSIPLLSRIISIADSYDAMTQDRPYRKAMTREAAIQEIQNNSGTQFDPSIVNIFLGNILD